MNKLLTRKLYGNYFIGDREDDFYLMIDTHNNKLVRLIDEDCFNIIELLSDIKNDIKDL